MTDTEIQIKALLSEIHNLKKDFAFKLEEIQALYMENKKHREMSEKLELENKHLKPVSYTHLTLPTKRIV